MWFTWNIVGHFFCVVKFILLRFFNNTNNVVIRVSMCFQSFFLYLSFYLSLIHLMFFNWISLFYKNHVFQSIYINYAISSFFSFKLFLQYF